MRRHLLLLFVFVVEEYVLLQVLFWLLTFLPTFVVHVGQPMNFKISAQQKKLRDKGSPCFKKRSGGQLAELGIPPAV